MRPVDAQLSGGTVRIDALFASQLQQSDRPGAQQVLQAAEDAVRQYGIAGCAGRVAQEFGDHPETAAPRMRWVRWVMAEAACGSGPQGTHSRPAA